MSVERAPREVITRIMDGYLSTQLLYVAAKLRLADLLAKGPRSSAELATATGTDASALHRLLRGLVLEGVIDEQPIGQFSLTEAGGQLRSDIPGSLLGAVLARGELYYPAAAGLIETIRRGGSAFQHIYGIEVFEHLAAHPDRAAVFQESMLSRSRGEAEAVVAACDFTPFHHVVDIAGGYGATLTAVLTKHSHLTATLFDRPEVIAVARERLAGAGISSRCDAVAGDFFAGVPRGGDLYLLSRVLHDWHDAEATRILRSCRAAMADGSHLLVIEAMLGEHVQDQPAAVRMDLHMLTLASGRERTMTEFAELLRAAGFQPRRVITPPGSLGISIMDAIADGI